MKGKAIIGLMLTAIFATGVQTEADACTNVIVTKGASVDGSVLVSYAADSHALYGELYFQDAMDWKPGAMRKFYEWDTNRYLGEIPQVLHTYKRVGNMNEHQLLIAESTFGGREELFDSKGIMDYGSLIYIALERCKTAREAITLMTDLVEKYGYYSSGESFSIADKNEVWVMELIGKGENNKGAVWVAVRIPEGYITAHANQARITTFPLNDPENCIYSKDVISFAREKGYFSGKDKDFSFAEAYCPADFGTARGCDARAWSAFNILGDGKFTFEDADGNLVTRNSYDYLDYAMGHNLTNRFPLCIKPSRKLSVKDVADVMRDHYEGTPMDMTQDIGAGGNALPYRWRPMGFEYNGKKYINERAIATQQTGFWFVGETRSNLPDVIGGILWFGTDDAATSYLTPIYTNVTKVPRCFEVGNGDMITYSATSSFWINNRVSNACYKMYNQMAPCVREKIDEFENNQIEAVKTTDLKALDLYNKAVDKARKDAQKKNLEYNPIEDTGINMAAVKRLLTSYSVSTAQEQFHRWVKLEETLLVKFIDGNVKAQNPDGTFKHTKDSKHIPEGITQPGYTDFWKEAVAKFHGKVIEEK